MKKRVFLLLGGLGLLCGASTAKAVDQVIIPQGGERWSIGSTVQIEWQLADAETVDLKLVAEDDTEYVIVEAIDNTGHFTSASTASSPGHWSRSKLTISSSLLDAVGKALCG